VQKCPLKKKGGTEAASRGPVGASDRDGGSGAFRKKNALGSAGCPESCHLKDTGEKGTGLRHNAARARSGGGEKQNTDQG